MDRPYRPSSEERMLYYYGLPSGPALVARSSSFPWRNLAAIDPWPIRKVILPPKDHPLIELWSNSTSSLRQRLIGSLNELKWTAVDFVRIGYDRDPVEAGIIDSEDVDQPMTMLVTVPPGSTTWEVGVQAITLSRAILISHGIKDIHCELKESTILRTASYPTEKLHASLGSNVCGSVSEKSLEIQRSELLGTSIAPFSHPDRMGTKGLYLRVKSESGDMQSVVLTCRHVVGDLNCDMSKAFRKHKEQASTAIIQPCDTVLYQLLEKSQDNTYASELMLRQATRLANKTGSLAKPEDGQKSLHSAQSELDTIKGLLDPECRVFGHVLYGAGLKVKEDKEKFRWIPDWALVGLEAEKHHTDLPNLQNRIHLTDSNATKLAGFFRKGKGANVDRGPPFDGSRYYLSLGGTVPASELWKAEVPPLIVGKVGAKTGTTFGIANVVKSVTRNACADLPCLRDQICEEWCIIGMEDESGHQVPFSSNGDSGACVWTMDGRIAGIIAAGNGTGKIQDITYAMIWERLAEDIVDHGYEISSFPAKED